MLFHSQAFILGFLPLVLAAYYAAARHAKAREWVLLLASLVFYGWWDVRFLPLLLGQCTATWLASERHCRTGNKGWLWAGVAVNLLSLAFFKYTAFLVSTVSALAGFDLPPPHILLPIGISFFTFQLACYLVDLARGDAHHHPWRRITLFVSLFPHLVAGPIVRHSEIMPQLDASPLRDGLAERFAKGIAFFVIGCAKKVFLADPLALSADQMFAAAQTGAPSAGDAWHGALAFSLQLFLDFSAYTEMAIGLGLMLGVRFPDNFNAPYQATDLRDFWRRWHMTLSRLIRDYLYIPLGGSRQGWSGYVTATLITMGLCGLWHGAGWTFVLWGTLQGVAIVIATLWARHLPRLPPIVGWALTTGFFIFTAVFFRAGSLEAAWNIFQGLAVLPPVRFEGRNVIAAAMLCAFLLPSTQEICTRLLSTTRLPVPLGLGLAMVLVLVALGERQSYQFIYFQF